MCRFVFAFYLYFIEQGTCAIMFQLIREAIISTDYGAIATTEASSMIKTKTKTNDALTANVSSDFDNVNCKRTTNSRYIKDKIYHFSFYLFLIYFFFFSFLQIGTMESYFSYLLYYICRAIKYVFLCFFFCFVICNKN